MLALLLTLLAASPPACGTPDRQRDVRPHNYVFFGQERERIADTAFLAHPSIVGAQLKYTWRELEPAQGRYDFRAIRRDLAFLKRHDKRLFLQLQDP